MLQKPNISAPPTLGIWLVYLAGTIQEKSGLASLNYPLWIDTHFTSFNFVSTNKQVRDSLTMALTDQRTTSVKAVQLVSGSLYQVTQVANGISLEAQVNNNRNSM